MPLEAKKITNFDTKLMKVTTEAHELKKRIEILFNEDKRFHDFIHGKNAIEHLQTHFSENMALYVGMFNDKPICAVIATVVKITEIELHALVMHKENFNRGIEEQFLKLIKLSLNPKNVRLMSKNIKIMQLIH